MNRGKWVIPIFILLVIFALSWQWIYYHIYPFDRITVTYSVKADGIGLAKIKEYCEYDNKEKIHINDDGKSFKIKGGKYGKYKFGFVLCGDEILAATDDERFNDYGDVELSIVYFETNRWNITNIDIKIDLVDENGEWYVYYDVEYADALENDKLQELKKVKLSEVTETEIFFGI